MKSELEKVKEITEEKKYYDNSYSEELKKKITEAKNSVIRQMRMDNNEENKLIVRDLHDTIAPPGNPRRIKDTKIMQILRLVSEDLYREPNVMAKPMEGQNELITYTVDAIVNELKTTGGYKNAVRKALKSAVEREGTSFIMVTPSTLKDKRNGKEKVYDKLEYRNLDSAYVFIDPAASRIDEAEWVGIRYEKYNDEAKRFLEEVYGWDGELNYGDCLYVVNKQESGDNDEDLIPDRTAIYEFWDKSGKRCVIAGIDGQEIITQEGDEYPYFDEYGQPGIPIEQIDATAIKYHLYAMSYVDAAKDVTEQCKRQFNQVLPYFDRVSNQLLAITGVTPLEDIASQINEAEDYQEQGMIPFLSFSDPQARVTPVFPSDITAPLERIRSIFADELGDRLGLDLRIQEKAEGSGVPTATQIVERAKTHSKAVGNINKINVPFYSNICKITLNYARSIWDNKDDRSVVVKTAGESEYQLPLSDALEATKNWRGEFAVDTTVEIELTRNEQVIVIQEIKANFVKDLQIPALSEPEIKPLADAMKAHIKLVGMDKYFQDSEVDAFYMGIIQRGQAQMQAEIEQKQQEAMQEEEFAMRKGATRSTPEGQRAAAQQGANAPQPV